MKIQVSAIYFWKQSLRETLIQVWKLFEVDTYVTSIIIYIKLIDVKSYFLHLSCNTYFSGSTFWKKLLLVNEYLLFSVEIMYVYKVYEVYR